MSAPWDEIDESSWESFPASDPPAWIGREAAPAPATRPVLPYVAGAVLLLAGAAIAWIGYRWGSARA